KRGAMFSKLRLARFMRTSTTPHNATINILGRAGRIAAEHHYGLRGKVNNHVEYTYPERKLLGFSREDREAITSMVLNHLK
ncbi:phage virion morphogenesis protein, partial [Cellvibrio mixtus]|uniref:phage virion morphogenesis protein n=1 Tax=Cellvibrio mixtus TaxID=39650 RepID=UPI000587008E